jgi:hypothetical protein
VPHLDQKRGNIPFCAGCYLPATVSCADLPRDESCEYIAPNWAAGSMHGNAEASRYSKHGDECGRSSLVSRLFELFPRFLTARISGAVE